MHRDKWKHRDFRAQRKPSCPPALSSLKYTRVLSTSRPLHIWFLCPWTYFFAVHMIGLLLIIHVSAWMSLQKKDIMDVLTFRSVSTILFHITFVSFIMVMNIGLYNLFMCLHDVFLPPLDWALYEGSIFVFLVQYCLKQQYQSWQ